jgi:hypothetical protein
MTRKKWTRLRRQRPELFGSMLPFEKWENWQHKFMRKVSKRSMVAEATANILAKDKPL